MSTSSDTYPGGWTSLDFARAVQRVASEARRHGLTVPGFRSGRGQPYGVRTWPGGATVNVDRDQPMVRQLIAGVLEVNGLAAGTEEWNVARIRLEAVLLS